MKLDEIVDQLFDITTGIEYNTISYFNPLLVSVQNKPKPDDLLLAIAVPLKRDITNNSPVSKDKLTEALKALKIIAKDYQIKELKKPIADLKTYLDSLG